LHREWFLKIGQGASLRNLEAAPIPVSKKMAHTLREAPRSLTVDSAFRWAQVRAMGANEALAGAILHTYLGRNKFRNDDYWQEVIRWMVLVEIRPNDVQNIVDYLTHELHYAARISMKGRTLNSVARLSAAWHIQLRQNHHNRYMPVDLDWDRYKLDDIVVKGSGSYGRDAVMVQLSSSAELRAEGQMMRHCVSTYAYRCSRAESVIFSLRWRDHDASETALATVEMAPNSKTLVQIKSVGNSQPGPLAADFIRRWAAQVGCTIPGRLLK
jgi:hypothetical protein